MWLAVALAAVHHAVPDRRQVVPVEPPVSQPTQQGVKRGGVIRQIISTLVEDLAAVVGEAHTSASVPDPARLGPKLQGLCPVPPQPIQGDL